jgi:mono/diheme cytochrome c family protein
MAEQDYNKINVYLDDDPDTIVSFRPPVRFELDTTKLEDGKHTLRVEAFDASGCKGIRTIPFEVRNGPGIGVEGLRDHDILDGKVPVLINAYGGAREPYWEPERAETPAPVPTWAWVLLLTIVAWSAFYIAQQWNAPEKFAATPTYGSFSGSEGPAARNEKPTAPESKANIGAVLYGRSCASCHQGNGEGIPGVFPPLAGDPVVTDKDPARHIEVVLFGMQGQAINGIDYAAAMPPFSELLTDEEVAAIINHERTSWGNNAPTVTVEQVQKIRAQGNSEK